ncbi:MAG: TonB-dependent receptor [Bacteroidales bacterium]|nr:TonB-dependent receptor [Bacteroidales bacterium]
MKKILTLILTLVSVVALAQSNISGVVLGEDNSPIQFANIVLSASDSSFVSGTITDVDGRFSIEKNPKASFIVISCLGYETATLNLNSDFSNVVLKASDMQLDEITISAGLPKTRIKDGAMVTDVQNSILAKTTTAEKMLAKLPGVRTTQDGIEIFGKGTPEIYINGVKMRDKSELQNIDPKNVKTVEVISNPGAEYDAEVQSVIRITTIKPVGDGMSFNLLGQYSQCDNADFYSNLNLNYRKKNLDLFGGVEWSDMRMWQLYKTHNEMQSNALWELDEVMDCDFRMSDIMLSAGTNYQFDDNNFAGFKYKFYDDLRNDEPYVANFDVFKDRKLHDNITEHTNESTPKGYQYSVNAYYNGKIGGFGVDFNVDYFQSDEETSTLADEDSENEDDRVIPTSDKVQSRMAAEKLVLSHPLFGGKVKFGGENVATNYTDKFKSLAEDFVPTVESENRQRTTAAFLQYSYPISDNLNVNAGLRYENVDFKHYNGDVFDQETSRRYDNWFPSVNVGYTPGDFEMNISYVKKTKRPSYYSLRNAILYDSRYSMEMGNSALLPREISDLTYMVSWDFLEFSFSYKNIKNATYYWDVINDDHPEAYISQMVNADKRLSQLAFNLCAEPEFGVYTPTFDLTLAKQDFRVVSQSVTRVYDKPRFTAEIDNVFSLESGWTFDLDFYFYGRGHSDESYYKSNYCVFDFCVSKSFFADALSVEVGVSDITNHEGRDERYYYSRGFQDLRLTYDSREFYLQVNYRFNPAKSKYKGTGAGNEERARM